MHKLFISSLNEYIYHIFIRADPGQLCCASFFSLQRAQSTNDDACITMHQQQQYIIILGLFTETVYHSKATWKTIRRASRIGWLNMAEWLSFSCIDLDIGESSAEGSTCHPNVQLISNTIARGDSVHVRWYAAYSHIWAGNSWHNWMRFSSEILTCMKVNAEVHGGTQDGPSCTFLQGLVCMSLCVQVLLCEVRNEILTRNSRSQQRKGPL